MTELLNYTPRYQLILPCKCLHKKSSSRNEKLWINSVIPHFYSTPASTQRHSQPSFSKSSFHKQLSNSTMTGMLNVDLTPSLIILKHITRRVSCITKARSLVLSDTLFYNSPQRCGLRAERYFGWGTNKTSSRTTCTCGSSVHGKTMKSYELEPKTKKLNMLNCKLNYNTALCYGFKVVHTMDKVLHKSIP